MKKFFANALITAGAFALKDQITAMVQSSAQEVHGVQTLVQTSTEQQPTMRLITDYGKITPQANECVLYQAASYGEAKVVLSTGGVKTGNFPSRDAVIHDLTLITWGNTATSFECGAKVFAKFCDSRLTSVAQLDRYCSDDHGSSSAGTVKVHHVGNMNNSIDTVFMWNYDELLAPAVTVFDMPNCTGWSQALYPGEYDQYGMYANNIYPNYIYSVRVPFGLQIEMWTMNGQDGTPSKVGGKKKWGNEAFFCSGNVPQPYTARSLSVEQWYPFGEGPIGTNYAKKYMASWFQLGSGNGKVTREVRTSVTNSSSTSNTVADRLALSVATEAGFEFEGMSAKVTLTTEASREVQNTITKELQQTEEKGFQAECEVQPGEIHVAVWQYEIKTKDSQGKEVTLSTNHYRCRTGVGAYQSPACPPQYCADSGCDKCTEGWKV